MKQIQYVKYNKMRREAFQIKTRICEEDGVRFVEKEALRPGGEVHIRRFAESFEQLSAIYSNVSFLKPEFHGDVMRYAYIEAPTLDEILEERIRGGADAVSALKEALDQVLAVRDGGWIPFEKTEKFTEVFGPV